MPNNTKTNTKTIITPARAIVLFCCFASAYFFSNIVRAITATISPVLTQSFALQASDLGLLAGGYFLGFAAMQLPMGSWLDRYGPKKVLLFLLCFAVLGCASFSIAHSFWQLWISRIFIGIGVSSCLMAPLTAYRILFSTPMQLRANSWMLMVGAMGMLASTLPVQWALPVLGWRAIFMALSVFCAFSMMLIWLGVPSLKTQQKKLSSLALGEKTAAQGYAYISRNAYFRRVAPLAFVNYGGVAAMQTLWAGPWMQKIVGLSAEQTSAGLFAINLVMLFVFLIWGWMLPRLNAEHWGVNRLATAILPLAFLVLAYMAIYPQNAQWWCWAAFLACSSPLAFLQSRVAMGFDAHLAGRALSLFNLLIFSGTFFVQWGFGVCIDVFLRAGFGQIFAYQGALWVYLACCILAYGWFCWYGRSKYESI